MDEVRCAWCEKKWENTGLDWFNVSVVKQYAMEEGGVWNILQDHDFCCMGHMLSYWTNIRDQLDASGSAISETHVQYNQRYYKEQANASNV